MVPRDHYFVEMSTLHVQRLIINGWFAKSNCCLATISSQPTDMSSLTWPGAYRFEIISAGMQVESISYLLYNA